MNGIESLPGLQLQNPIVEMLQNLLVEAKAGRITSIAAVLVNGQGGYASPFFGNQAALLAGTVILQDVIMTSIKAPQNRPAIIPARMA